MYDDGFLKRLEDGVRAALPLWDVSPDTELKLLTISENATFRATGTGRATDLVFRVHRPEYHTLAEIESELAWIGALRAEGVVATPEPVALRKGGLVAHIDDAGSTRHVVAFEHVTGEEPREGEDLARWFTELGAIHARLHAHSKRWKRPDGFVRKVWNHASTVGNTPLWGDWRAGLGLTAEGRAILERTVRVLGDRLAALGDGPESFGLVHADLRLANLLVDGDRLTLIDFDDCGFSWYLYDFAAAVSFLEHEPYIPALRDAWVEGYRTVALLSEAEAGLLPTLVMLRRILLTAWVASHAETPTALSMGTAYTDGTVALAEAYLSAQEMPAQSPPAKA